VTRYAALTARGAEVAVTADSPAEGMADAASRCEPGDWPVALYSVDERGAWVRPVWGGPRGLAGEYPPGEAPEDAERLFGPGAR
jgi:hypothetical protein